jgi:hypothetical protein
VYRNISQAKVAVGDKVFHKISLEMNNEKPDNSQKLRVIEEKQGHIQESGVQFYNV